MSQRPPDTTFASRSVRVHVLRGVLGLAAAVGAFALLRTIGPASLLLLVVAGVAWRGCPTCWAVGLTRTKATCASGAGCAEPAEARASTRPEARASAGSKRFRADVVDELVPQARVGSDEPRERSPRVKSRP